MKHEFDIENVNKRFGISVCEPEAGAGVGVPRHMFADRGKFVLYHDKSLRTVKNSFCTTTKVSGPCKIHFAPFQRFPDHEIFICNRNKTIRTVSNVFGPGTGWF